MPPQRREVAPVHEDPARRGPVEGHQQPDHRALAGAARAHERRRGPLPCVEGDAVQDRRSRLVLEAHVLEGDVAHDPRAGRARAVLFVLGPPVAHLPDPVDARERFAELGRGVGDPHQGCDEQADEEHVHDEVAEGHRPREDLASPEEDEQSGDAAEEDEGERAHGGAGRHLPGHAREEPLEIRAEGPRLALLGAVGLHHADSGERLGEPPHDLRGDLRPLAVEGADQVERVHDESGEGPQEHQGHGGEPPVQPEQHPEGEEGREDASRELDETRAQDVPDPLGVRHDPRDEAAAAGRVEEGDGQVQDLGLQLAPDLQDRPVGGDAQDARESEGGQGLEDRGGDDGGASGASRETLWRVRTSSTRNLLEAGRARAATRLARSRRKPRARRPRWARTSSPASRQARREVVPVAVAGWSMDERTLTRI